MRLSNAIIYFEYQNFSKLSSIKIIFELSNFKKNLISKNTKLAYLDRIFI